MSLELPNIVDIIEVMENYVARIRPPEHVRDKLDISYKIENQSVILHEIRPSVAKPATTIEPAYAKATYVKRSKRWKVYWMRGNLKWYQYDPMPEVGNLKEFVQLVEKDAYGCFKG